MCVKAREQPDKYVGLFIMRMMNKCEKWLDHLRLEQGEYHEKVYFPFLRGFIFWTINNLLGRRNAKRV
ncbi:hypothetical protein ACTHO5_22685 [Cytobacillus praedii]